MSFRIAALASTRGTDLQAILHELEAGKLPGVELTKVLSNVETCGALEKARTHGIETVFVNPTGLSPEEYDAKLIETIGEVDLICLIGYMKILTPSFVRHYKNRIINVHPSLLPKYGGKGWYGRKIHEAVLTNGDKESGMTIHFVDEGVDSGEILLQEKVSVEPDETVESLQAKVQKLEKKAYPEAIRMLS